MNRIQIEAHLALLGWVAVRDERWGASVLPREQYELHGPWRCYCAGPSSSYARDYFPPGAEAWRRINLSAIPDGVFAELVELALGDPP